MTNSDNRHGGRKLPGVEYVLCVDDLNAEWINNLLSDFRSVNCDEMTSLFSDKMQMCEEEEWPRLKLLTGLSSMILCPDDKDPFIPCFDLFLPGREDLGRRTGLSPDILLPGQIDELYKLASQLDNPGLRARIADVTWLVKRRYSDMAELAVSSYCECVEKVRRGEAQFGNEKRCSWGTESWTLLRRAARICSENGWSLQSSDKLKDTISETTDLAYSNGSIVDFHRMTTIMFNHNDEFALDYKRLATRYHTKAKESSDGLMLSTRREIWETAAKYFENAGKESKYKMQAEQCYINAMNVYEEEARKSKDDLRTIMLLNLALEVDGKGKEFDQQQDGIAERIVQFSKVLEDSTTGTIEHIEVNGTDVSNHKKIEIRDLSFQQAIRKLFDSTTIPSPEEVETMAKEQMRHSPLADTVTTFRKDDLGVILMNSDEKVAKGEQHSNRDMQHFSDVRCICRELDVNQKIEPLREELKNVFNLDEAALRENLNGCLNIPEEYRDEIILGAHYFLNGRHFEALNILNGCLERILRHSIQKQGVQVIEINKKRESNQVTLGMMLRRGEKYRKALVKELGEENILEIELLFWSKQGPNLRNNIAHSRFTLGKCNDPNSIFASWFILRLVNFGLDHDAEQQ